MKFRFKKKKDNHLPKVILGIIGVAAVSAVVSYLFESERIQKLTSDLKDLAAKQNEQ